MTLKDLKFKPGMFTDDTDRDVGDMGYWKAGDKVRFRHGRPQSMGGWVKDDANNVMVGTARGVVDWFTLRLEKFIAFGTNKKLYIWEGGVFHDITPVRASSTINANPFATTDTSTTVTVTDTSHGAIDGAYVTFSGAAAVGGITVSGEYVLTYIDENSYTITHSAAATSTTTGGGAVVVAAYQINPGLADSSADLGWGAGPYGGEAWGTPRTVSDLITYCRTWTLDTWGEDLIATHFNGSIYLWDSSLGTTVRATLISAAPTSNKVVAVSQESRHVIALGAGGDPMYIQWCDGEDYTDWTSTETNTAGAWRVDQGSQLLALAKAKDQHILFTDAAVYIMLYVGPPFVFSIKPAGLKGIAGPNAFAVRLGIVYWMGNDNFYFFDGAIQTIDCPVYNSVFEDINTTQRFKCWAYSNTAFDEITWLYCSESSTEVDKYATYNVTEKTWVIGTLARTLMVADSDIISTPYGTSSDGYMYRHETGITADGAALHAYLESGDFEIESGGDHVMHISKFIPDFKLLTGTVNVTLSTKGYPQDTTPKTKTTAVTSTTKYFNPRVRGRQLSVKIDSNATDASWRMGLLRMDPKPHGRRP